MVLSHLMLEISGKYTAKDKIVCVCVCVCVKQMSAQAGKNKERKEGGRKEGKKEGRKEGESAGSKSGRNTEIIGLGRSTLCAGMSLLLKILNAFPGWPIDFFFN